MGRALKILAVILGVYVAIVVVFESLLGYFQPEADNTIVITTTRDGTSHDRVLTLLESDGGLYVAVNHWPRAWYRRALDNPEVQVRFNGEPQDYEAVPVSDAEDARLRAEHPIGLPMRFLMGFAPRHFLRLDPADAG